MKILLKFWTKNSRRPILRYGTNPRVLTQKLASLNWQKAYLKVSYGYDIDNFGKKKLFYNEGEYFNKKDLKQAFRAFIEK